MEIKSSFGTYVVKFLESHEDLVNNLDGHTYSGVIVDSRAAEEHLELQTYLKGLNTLLVEVNETNKEYGQIERIYDWMVKSRFDRKSELLAIGGGTIQDIATFVSATFHRGLSWSFIPTTLLAQADSCIGGKCGINLGPIKNQIGLVYPPSNIFVVRRFLETLETTDLLAGMGEILKIAVTGQNQFWDTYRSITTNTKITDLDFSSLTKLALEAKKYVIEEDEMERDFRRVLNYGHTLGHAIESASNFRIPHGIAVILGIKAITYLGMNWRITNRNLGEEVLLQTDLLLEQCDLPLDFDSEKAALSIQHDKKTIGGSAVFVVLKEAGIHEFHSRPIGKELNREIMAVLDGL